MIPALHISENQGFARVAEPIVIGLPLPKGMARATNQLTLVLADGLRINTEFSVSARWPDGSIRWCLAVFHVSLQANTQLDLFLNVISPEKEASGFKCEQTETGVRVSTSHYDAELIPGKPGLDLTNAQDQKFSVLVPELLNVKGELITAYINNTKIQNPDAPLRLNILQEGFFETEDGKTVLFELNWFFFSESPLLQLDITCHNQERAEHANGHWDLGDPGSFHFKKLSASLIPTNTASDIGYQLNTTEPWSQVSSSARISQMASGGTHWQSRVHVDASNEVPLKKNGYQCINGDDIAEGKRAEPIVFTTGGCSLIQERFWQNFPSELEISPARVNINLFPAQDSFHELQGGEKKTHSVYFHFAQDYEALKWVRSPLHIRLADSLVSDSQVLPAFSTESDPLDKIINLGLSQEKGFFAKREIADEFGWRNFGDIFADHESLYLDGEKHFISHYNNQYDPIFGFLQQFLKSGNSLWFELADDLAKHVCDIDIYHTEKDRNEYSGGLFWHTDHYVDAFTSTHRTYSVRQKPDGEYVTGGGGPGGQHCYTTGLALHSLLTGNQASHKAVFTLTNWITYIYEGSGTVVEHLLKIKESVLPKLKHRSPGKGYINHPLPLDRGVGNYVNALIDCFVLSCNENFLERAESVIRRTINPLDPIEQRHLKDVERTWFYTVFLQAVIRYLSIVNTYGKKRPEGITYAVSSVMHYARWMLEHEDTYLSNADILDYPNDTWVAQEIRKANILYFAASQAESNAEKQAFIDKADYFYNYVAEHLNSSQESHFSRLLAILMQNHGGRNYKNLSLIITDKKHSLPLPYATRGKLLWQLVKDSFLVIWKFSLKKELRWLSFRSGAFKKIYTRFYGSP